MMILPMMRGQGVRQFMHHRINEVMVRVVLRNIDSYRGYIAHCTTSNPLAAFFLRLIISKEMVSKLMQRCPMKDPKKCIR